MPQTALADLDSRASRFGPLLRRCRAERHASQLELAVAADVSPRHLSFIETGRAAPSREMVLRLGAALDLPMRACNELLLAAGYAPAYRQSALAEPIMGGVKTALDFILKQQEPYPALVVDRGWNIVGRNDASLRLRTAFLDDDKVAAAGAAARNAMKLFFDPLLYRPFVLDWEAVAQQIVLRVWHEARWGGQGDCAAQLLNELLDYPDVPKPNFGAGVGAPPNGPLMTVTLRRGRLTVKYFSTLSTFGTPQDITLQELRVKCFFPADDSSAAVFERLRSQTRADIDRVSEAAPAEALG